MKRPIEVVSHLKPPITLEARRQLAADWLGEVCSVQGIYRYSRLFRWVTERRDPGPGYSCCADLAHWLLFILGCREPFINRTEHNGWVSQVNIARLIWGCPFSSHGNMLQSFDVRRLTPKRGDILVTWRMSNTSDAHVMIYDSHSQRELRTWDYGQGPMAREAWRDREHIEGRYKVRRPWEVPIKAWLPLENVPFTAEPIPPPSGEMLDAIELNDWRVPR